MKAGAFEWRPSCEEPWTGGQWREALQRAAAAALNKDPSYVRYILSAKLLPIFIKFFDTYLYNVNEMKLIAIVKPQ